MQPTGYIKVIYQYIYGKYLLSFSSSPVKSIIPVIGKANIINNGIDVFPEGPKIKYIINITTMKLI